MSFSWYSIVIFNYFHVCPFKSSCETASRLEWMDAASCLAAERHCGRSAVTLVMDDLDFKDLE